MIPDEAVLEPIGYYSFEELLEEQRRKHPNCPEEQLQRYAILEFQTRHTDFFTTEDIAHEQGVSPVLIEFKYKALLEKGFNLPISPELRNDYLKNQPKTQKKSSRLHLMCSLLDFSIFLFSLLVMMGWTYIAPIFFV